MAPISFDLRLDHTFLRKLKTKSHALNAKTCSSVSLFWVLGGSSFVWLVHSKFQDELPLFERVAKQNETLKAQNKFLSHLD